MTDAKDRLLEFWEHSAATYDRSPSHALSDPGEATAWREALRHHLPPPGARILDAGAGTGSLALLAAELGYKVTALDFSESMVDLAREKAMNRGLEIEFVVADVTEPPSGPFHVVIARHVLWTQPDPVAALAAWRRVAPNGRLVLYEALSGRLSISRRIRDALAALAGRAMRIPEDHHPSFDTDLLEGLPLVGASSLDPFREQIRAAGWRRWRVERLWDIERAGVRPGPGAAGQLQAVTRHRGRPAGAYRRRSTREYPFWGARARRFAILAE
jgi:ubiquinone/menaquinone biosynthesis C-methylase UbiE